MNSKIQVKHISNDKVLEALCIYKKGSMKTVCELLQDVTQFPPKVCYRAIKKFKDKQPHIVMCEDRGDGLQFMNSVECRLW